MLWPPPRRAVVGIVRHAMLVSPAARDEAIDTLHENPSRTHPDDMPRRRARPGASYPDIPVARPEPVAWDPGHSRRRQWSWHFVQVLGRRLWSDHRIVVDGDIVGWRAGSEHEWSEGNVGKWW